LEKYYNIYIIIGNIIQIYSFSFSALLILNPSRSWRRRRS